MQVTISYPKNKDRYRKYPYIGISTKLNNTIILFIEPGMGIFLRNDNIEEIGAMMVDKWIETDFQVFLGSVTITND